MSGSPRPSCDAILIRLRAASGGAWRRMTALPALRWLAALLWLTASATGCGGPLASMPCVPGAVVACACPGAPGGAQGVQACRGDGAGFGACTGCPGAALDAGLGVDLVRAPRLDADGPVEAAVPDFAGAADLLLASDLAASVDQASDLTAIVDGGGAPDAAVDLIAIADGRGAFDAASDLARAADLVVAGRTWYISLQGNDANDGQTPQTPLRTIALGLSRARAGDAVFLVGGQSFTEVIDIKPGFSGANGKPITVTSDANNRARIIAPAGKSGIAIYNASFWTIENLIIVGPGMGLTKSVGVRALADGGRYQGLVFRNLDVSGFYEGLSVLSYVLPSDGFTDVLIDRCECHHNLQGGGSTYATAPTGMQNIVVRDSRFHHNPGDPAVKRPSGDGFVLGGVTNGLIERCVAHDNGGQGTNVAGPVGLWAYSSDKVTIQLSESYANRARLQDGDGFDLDIGVTNSVIQYCYSHDNYGAGYLFSQAGNAPWKNNVIRYNVSENDASGKKLGAITLYSAAGGLGLVDGWIYGNTVYTSVGPALNTTSEGNASNLHVFNNLFVTANNQVLVINFGQVAKAGILRIQGNLYWASGGAALFEGHASLAAWRAGTGQELLGNNPVGQFADPKLTAAGMGGTIGDPAKLNLLTAYQLRAGSPAIDRGIDPKLIQVPPPPRDYYGAPLPQGVGYDVGAHEWR